MKNFVFLIICLILSLGISFAQPTENGSTTIFGSGTQIVQIGGSSYDNGTYAIGKDMSGGVSHIYRTYFEFDLSGFPSGTQISNVTVNYSNGNIGSYTLKLSQVATVSTDRGANWIAIGNGSSLHTGVPYAGSSFTSAPIKTAIQNALSSKKIYIGALSENESSVGSNSSMTLNFYVTYTYPAPQLTIYVRNDLEGGNGGNIGETIYPNSPVSRLSPWTDYPYETQKLNLAAYDDQNIDGKNWFFNDTESPNNKSYWYEDKNGNKVTIGYSQSMTTNPLTKSHDDGSTFAAKMRTNSFTTSGTMSSSEEWFTNVSLTGNVTLGSVLHLQLTRVLLLVLMAIILIQPAGLLIYRMDQLFIQNGDLNITVCLPQYNLQ